MQNVIINGNTYEEVQKVQIPLSDGSGNADFIDTTGATAKAENIDKGFNAFVDGELVIGTKESAENLFPKIGEYEVVTLTNTSSAEVSVVKGLLKDLPSEERIDLTSNLQINYVLLMQEQDKTNTTDAQFYFGYVGIFWSGDSLIRANTGATNRLTYNASGLATVANASIMGVGEFDESQGYVKNEDLVINQFDKFPSGKVTAYLVKSPF